jgi:HAD superfamily hydrolase (TIGR01509 family)
MNAICKAVIFDFNGTLFNDTGFHNQAWINFAFRHGKSLSYEDLELHIHGFTNREILKFIFQRELLPEEAITFSEEKEEIYRSLCYKYPEKCVFAPGAESFLNTLKQRNIARTIATASYLKNLLFYNTLFNLEQWFDLEKIVYDTGEYRGKPFPDMFLAAAAKISTPIEHCLIIEDSLGGVQAARNAGAGRIIAMDSMNNAGKFSQFDFIDQIITDFRQVDLIIA